MNIFKLFKRWFSYAKEQDLDDSQNPWAGLASYEDPEIAKQKLRFCGRDDDSYDLAHLIMGNAFVTLYGKSGIGKTSLLNAGVFPELREEQYTPVSIRLGMREEEHPQSYQTMIIEAVERVVKRTETINVIDEQQDQQSMLYLWNYFALHRFYDKYDKPTTPVIVFDQFEEALRDHRDEVETLLRQLDYLNDKDHTLDSCEVEGVPYRYVQNFRFVVSIREDDLYRLEDSLDNCYLPALKRCRYRLRGLSIQGATDVITELGDNCIALEQRGDIVKRILELTMRPRSHEIDTLLLSLVCSGTYEKKTGEMITLSDLNVWKNNPMEAYYQDAIKDLNPRQIRFIQKTFIHEDGSRKRMNIEDVVAGLGENTYKALVYGKNKLLYVGEHGKVELSHDQLAKAIYDEKTKEQEKRIFLQRIFANGIFDSTVLAIDLFVFAFVFTTQGGKMLLFRLEFFEIGIILVFSTYIQYVTRISKDKKAIIFVIPQLLSTFSVFIMLKLVGGIMAYHIIKPSIIQILLKTFLWSNIALAAVTIITRLQMVHKTTSHPRWKDYFSIKRKENRFAQIALVASVMVTICVLLVIPDTHAERIRKLAEKGNAEAMIELGDYYMQYDKDVEKAIEWYKKAQKQGADVSDCISNATKRNNTQLTDSMKVEAYIALLSNYQLRGLDAVRKMENGFFNSGDVNTIMNYYDNNGEAYIRWLSFSAPLFSPKTEVYYANLGYEFWRGEYVEQDLVRAFELYLKGKSHQNVIKCYLNGWGVEKSLKSAIEYVEVEGCYDEAIAAFSPIKLFQR